MRDRVLLTSSTETFVFAPEATTIIFSPSAATDIIATPLRAFESFITWVVFILSSTNPCISMLPKSSFPTLPTMVTSPPMRAAATAWFAPLPPGNVSKSPPRTVSPGFGEWGTRTTRSILILPTTRIFAIR